MDYKTLRSAYDMAHNEPDRLTKYAPPVVFILFHLAENIASGEIQPRKESHADSLCDLMLALAATRLYQQPNSSLPTCIDFAFEFLANAYGIDLNENKNQK